MQSPCIIRMRLVSGHRPGPGQPLVWWTITSGTVGVVRAARCWMPRSPRLFFGVGDAAWSYTWAMSTDRITVDPARMAGAPTIRNTRVTVTAVLGQLAAGRTIDEILADYPYLEREDILAVLEFATESIERELPITAA